MNIATNSSWIEELKVLLISQHLHHWLAEHGEEDSGPLLRRARKKNLPREGSFAGPRGTGNQIKRVVRNSSSEYFVEAGDTRLELPNQADGWITNLKISRGSK